MRKLLTSVLSFTFLWGTLAFGLISPAKEKPVTRAEATGYKATSLYSDVTDFIAGLQRQSRRLRVETLGISAEGRRIPLIVIGDPVPASPLGLIHDDRLVV